MELENIYHRYVFLTGRASSILHDRLNDTDLTAGDYCSFVRIK